MEKDARAAGAGGIIYLGGKPWQVAQPSAADMKSIGVFVGRRVRSALSKLTEDPGWKNLSEKQQDRMIDALTVKDAAPDPTDMLKTLISPEGCRFLAWVLIRKKHPDVNKLADIDPHITEGNVEAVFMELDEASGMSELKNSAGLLG